MSESGSRNRRRSQRVKLQVSVLLRAALIDGKSVQVQAFTSAVNAHGGLLETPVRLTADQRILLINPYTRNDIGCKVVRVDGPSLDLYESLSNLTAPTRDSGQSISRLKTGRQQRSRIAATAGWPTELVQFGSLDLSRLVP